MSEDRLLVGIDLDDLIVVETRDSILISNKKSSQKVKNVVNYLKKNKMPQGITHTKAYRPWGNYLSLIEGNRWQVKLIEVKPGEELSLQMHHYRSEHWVIVKWDCKS